MRAKKNRQTAEGGNQKAPGIGGLWEDDKVIYQEVIISTRFASSANVSEKLSRLFFIVFSA